MHVLTKPRFGYVHLVLFVGVLSSLLILWVWSYKKSVDAATQRYVDRLNEAVLLSPLPAVQLADQEETPYKFQHDYHFTSDWTSRNYRVWDKAYQPFKAQPSIRYLEIGTFEGRSLLWMFENILTDPTASATVIDPFLGDYKNTYLGNLNKAGIDNRVTTIADFSQIALRKLPLDQQFDIIYIDGSHAKDDTLEDAVLSWRLLKEGGVMVFDDYQFIGAKFHNRPPTDFPKAAIDPFVQCFEKQLEVIHNSYQLIVRKKNRSTS